MFKYYYEHIHYVFSPTNEGYVMTIATSQDSVRVNAIRMIFPALTDASERYLSEIVTKLSASLDAPVTPIPDNRGVWARTFESTYILQSRLGTWVSDGTVADYLAYLIDLTWDTSRGVKVQTHKHFVEITLTT